MAKLKIYGKKMSITYTSQVDCTTNMVSGPQAAERFTAFLIKLPADKLPMFTNGTAVERAKELIRKDPELALLAYKTLATRGIAVSALAADHATRLLRSLFAAPLMDYAANAELVRSVDGAVYLAEAWSHATHTGVNKERVQATHIPEPKILDRMVEHLDRKLAELETPTSVPGGFLCGPYETLAKYVVAALGPKAFERYMTVRLMFNILLDSGIVYEPWVRHWINSETVRVRILRTPDVWNHQALAEELLKREVTDLIEQSTQNASCKYVVSITAIKKEV